MASATRAARSSATSSGHARAHAPGARALLRVEHEDAGDGETRLRDEVEQRVHVRLRLSRKAGDEGGPHGRAGQRRADAAQQLQIRRPIARPAHASQDPAGGVLEGQVHVRHGIPRQSLEKGLLDAVGLQIEYA